MSSQAPFEMTIIFVMHYAFPLQAGGIGSFQRDLSKTLLERHRLKLILVYPMRGTVRNTEICTGKGMLVHRPYKGLGPHFLGSLYPSAIWAPSRLLFRILKTEAPTALHLQSLFVPGLIAIALALSAKFAVPVVVTSHSETVGATAVCEIGFERQLQSSSSNDHGFIYSA